jgi:hypothetical protein
MAEKRQACPDPNDAYPGAHLLNRGRKRALGLLVPATIYIQDPMVAEVEPELRFVELELDWEPAMMAGPTSARLAVVDYDSDRDALTEPARWSEENRCFETPAGQQVDRSVADTPWFRQVNVWAVAQSVLDFFEDKWAGGLGRTIPWSFEGNRLMLVPQAGHGANACYDRHSKSLQFYYWGAGEDREFACLSHDIVAHETGHAVLDGIRPYYFENTSLQTMAFHEYVADITAILTAMRINEFRRYLRKYLSPEGEMAPDTALSRLAEQIGAFIEKRSDGYVRNADNEVRMDDVRSARGAHYCSQVLTGAMFDIWRELAHTYMQRSEKTTPLQALWYAVGRFKRVALRPLDYLPPVDVQFIDYARAVLQVLRVSNPDLRDHAKIAQYETFIRQAFEDRGLVDLDVGDDVEDLGFRYRYDIDRIARSRVDTYRFLHENRDALRIPYQQDFLVLDVYDTDTTMTDMRRLPREIVIQYVWQEEVEPPGIKGELAGVRVPLLCGGTLVFDGQGNVLSWMRKPGTEEVRCAPDSKYRRRGTALHKASDGERERGEKRRDRLLNYVMEQARLGLIRLTDDGRGDLVDISRAPVVGRTDRGMLRLEVRPHLRHWDVS